MKILLDIPDNKAKFFLEILKNLSFVKKATPITDGKAKHMQDIRIAVEEVNLIRAGKLKGLSPKEILDEL